MNIIKNYSMLLFINFYTKCFWKRNPIYSFRPEIFSIIIFVYDFKSMNSTVSKIKKGPVLKNRASFSSISLSFSLAQFSICFWAAMNGYDSNIIIAIPRIINIIISGGLVGCYSDDIRDIVTISPGLVGSCYYTH